MKLGMNLAGAILWGGCLVRNLIKNGSYKQPNNYFCKIRKSVLYDLILRTWKESQI
jgi:hypothetical protein